jgi:predicted DNA-binding WGR domain protein
MNADIRTSFTVIRQRDPQHSMERFYALSVQRNLFGS